MAAVDPAALLGAAIRAAVLAKAPRRTVQAVASAVTGVLVHSAAEAGPGAAAAAPAKEEVGPAAATPPTGASAEELVAALREARRAQRRRKKANRKARKGAREPSPSHVTTVNTGAALAVASSDNDGGPQVPEMPTTGDMDIDTSPNDEDRRLFRRLRNTDRTTPLQQFPGLQCWMFDGDGHFKHAIRLYNNKKGHDELFLENEEHEFKRYGVKSLLTRDQQQEYWEAFDQWEVWDAEWRELSPRRRRQYNEYQEKTWGETKESGGSPPQAAKA